MTRNINIGTKPHELISLETLSCKEHSSLLIHCWKCISLVTTWEMRRQWTWANFNARYRQLFSNIHAFDDPTKEAKDTRKHFFWSGKCPLARWMISKDNHSLSKNNITVNISCLFIFLGRLFSTRWRCCTEKWRWKWVLACKVCLWRVHRWRCVGYTVLHASSHENRRQWRI